MEVFPAYAGMIPRPVFNRWQPTSVPRIRGDDPNAYAQAQLGTQCSPHTRG